MTSEGIIESQNIDGWIIAGGSSTRMGEDKAALDLGGRNFIEMAADALSSIAGGRISIAGAPRAFVSGFAAFPDDDETGSGPLAGLASALKNSSTEWIAVIACDLPFVTGEVFSKLADESTAEADAVVPLQADGRPQPLCAMYRRTATLDAIKNVAKGENRSLRAVLSQINTLYVAFDAFREIENAEDLFLNVNSPGDYARAKVVYQKTIGSSR